MAKGHKPVAGSRAYWPKKRAKRIYDTFRSVEQSEEAVLLEFAGYKAGMTQVIYNDSRKNSPTHGHDLTEAVTVLDCPPLFVCGIKFYRKSGNILKDAGNVMSEKLPKELARRTSVPKKAGKQEASKKDKYAAKIPDNYDDLRLLVCTKPRESGIGKKKPELFELRIGGNKEEKLNYAREKMGSEISPQEVFKEGDWLDVKSVTKGKGFQGPVKRFGVTIRGRKHEKKRRHVGNLGSVGVGRVLPGKLAMPGQLGFQTRTEYNKRLLKIGKGDSEPSTPKGGFVNYGNIKGNYLLVHGSVPGPKKRLIMMRKAIRAPHERELVEVKKIIIDSQQ